MVWNRATLKTFPLQTTDRAELGVGMRQKPCCTQKGYEALQPIVSMQQAYMQAD